MCTDGYYYNKKLLFILYSLLWPVCSKRRLLCVSSCFTSRSPGRFSWQPEVHPQRPGIGHERSESRSGTQKLNYHKLKHPRSMNNIQFRKSSHFHRHRNSSLSLLIHQIREIIKQPFISRSIIIIIIPSNNCGSQNLLFTVPK